MLRFIYDFTYDALATVDVAGGVLLVSIWFQTGYVALFRAIHGDDAGLAPEPARPAARAAAPALAPRPPAPPGFRSPWAR